MTKAVEYEYVCAIGGCNNIATRVRQFDHEPHVVYRWCDMPHAGGTLKPRAKAMPALLITEASTAASGPLTSLVRDIQAVAIAAADATPDDQPSAAPVLLPGQSEARLEGAAADNRSEPSTYEPPCGPECEGCQIDEAEGADKRTIARLGDKLRNATARAEEREAARATLDALCLKVIAERDEARKQLGEALINSEERLAHANQLQADIEEEQRGRLLLRERHGARDDETFGMFIERAIKERPAVGTTHPVAVADADQRAHPEARWVGVGGYIGMFTRLPNRAPEAVNVSRLTPTVISPACNCDELIAARETLARLTSERDALTARLQSEHETRWWATYNVALTGVLAYSGNEPPLTKSPHKESALHADAAHGPRGSK